MRAKKKEAEKARRRKRSLFTFQPILSVSTFSPDLGTMDTRCADLGRGGRWSGPFSQSVLMEHPGGGRVARDRACRPPTFPNFSRIFVEFSVSLYAGARFKITPDRGPLFYLLISSTRPSDAAKRACRDGHHEGGFHPLLPPPNNVVYVWREERRNGCITQRRVRASLGTGDETDTLNEI